LQNVSLKVEEGETVGLIGPNGSGKSTLFNAISGVHRPDSGKIRLLGKSIAGKSPNSICQMGIGRTFQIVKPFQSLTVYENVLVGAMYGRGFGEKKLEDACSELLKFTGLEGKKDLLPGNLTIGDRRRIELTRALATNPTLLLLDEVMAGLNPVESNQYLELVENIGTRGIAILMIEHVMKVVMAISNRLYVLNFGEVIAEGKPEEVASNKKVISVYLGEETNA